MELWGGIKLSAKKIPHDNIFCFFFLNRFLCTTPVNGSTVVLVLLIAPPHITKTQHSKLSLSVISDS